MRVKRHVVAVNKDLCDGCGLCLTVCDPWALTIFNGKVRLVEEQYCSGKGVCTTICPKGALSLISRRAKIFNKKAVDNYLQSLFLHPLFT